MELDGFGKSATTDPEQAKNRDQDSGWFLINWVLTRDRGTVAAQGGAASGGRGNK